MDCQVFMSDGAPMAIVMPVLSPCPDVTVETFLHPLHDDSGTGITVLITDTVLGLEQQFTSDLSCVPVREIEGVLRYATAFACMCAHSAGYWLSDEWCVESAVKPETRAGVQQGFSAAVATMAADEVIRRAAARPQ